MKQSECKILGSYGFSLRFFNIFLGTFIVSQKLMIQSSFCNTCLYVFIFHQLCTFNLNFIIKRTIIMNRNKNWLWISIYLGYILGNRLLALSTLYIMSISMFYSRNGWFICPVNQLIWNRLRELMHICSNFW